MYINNLSTERKVPSPVAAGDSGRDPDTPAEPAWISIARQKQRVVQQEQELDREELAALDVKSDTEKQNKEKERTEVLRVQICDAFISPSCSILWIYCSITYQSCRNDYRCLMSILISKKDTALRNVLQIQSSLIVQIRDFISPRNPGTLWDV